MNPFEILSELIIEFFVSSHPAVIHFPIIGIMMGFTAGLTALTIRLLADYLDRINKISIQKHSTAMNFVDRFEFASFILVIMGIFGYGIAGITGFYSAGGVEAAINHEILEFKVRLSIFAVLLLFIPVVLKTYVGIVYKRQLFTNKSIVPAILYLVPLIIAAPITVVVAGAGGVYVYGHTVLDLIGLGWIIPGR